jgi:DNA modification methylase
VLDPFAGSGTTGIVADEMGQHAILIELSPKYARLASQRVANARARRLLGEVTDKPVPLPGQLGLFDPA